MAEAHDRCVGVVIARAPVPAVVVSVGTELHHPEGNGSARIGVPVATGAYEDVHEPRRVVVGGSRRLATFREQRQFRGAKKGKQRESTQKRSSIEQRASGMVAVRAFQPNAAT